MKLKFILISTFLTMFTWQGIADAASISTRVRILESKVAKHDKQLKESKKVQKQGEANMEKSLAKMKALEKKMRKMLEEGNSKKQQQHERTDKRYAYP
jgi:Skp family chaperone for outer membrane proteins